MEKLIFVVFQINDNILINSNHETHTLIFIYIYILRINNLYKYLIKIKLTQQENKSKIHAKYQK